MSHLNKRIWQVRQQVKDKRYVSPNSDSRVFCRRANRNKYLYETIAKAETALRFNEIDEIGTVRYYACDSCAGYHLTSKSLEEYLYAKTSSMPISLRVASVFNEQRNTLSVVYNENANQVKKGYSRAKMMAKWEQESHG